MEELLTIKLEGPDENFQIALVQNPAIRDDWQKFNEKTFEFKVSDKKRYILSGYAMIADLEIDRIDPSNGKPFKVKFTKDSIYHIVLNFFRQGLTKNFNEDHHTGELAPGVFLFESLFIDASRGINAPTGYSKRPDGSWFISVKVENPEIQKKIDEDEYMGFSVESKRFVEDKDAELDAMLKELE
ncbi:MAG: XkdF-like putative serine protease domain-containing protein [Bacteroidia bacterium]